MCDIEYFFKLAYLCILYFMMCGVWANRIRIRKTVFFLKNQRRKTRSQSVIGWTIFGVRIHVQTSPRTYYLVHACMHATVLTVSALPVESLLRERGIGLKNKSIIDRFSLQYVAMNRSEKNYQAVRSTLASCDWPNSFHVN